MVSNERPDNFLSVSGLRNTFILFEHTDNCIWKVHFLGFLSGFSKLNCILEPSKNMFDPTNTTGQSKIYFFSICQKPSLKNYFKSFECKCKIQDFAKLRFFGQFFKHKVWNLIKHSNGKPWIVTSVLSGAGVPTEIIKVEICSGQCHLVAT